MNIYNMKSTDTPDIDAINNSDAVCIDYEQGSVVTKIIFTLAEGESKKLMGAKLLCGTFDKLVKAPIFVPLFIKSGEKIYLISSEEREPFNLFCAQVDTLDILKTHNDFCWLYSTGGFRAYIKNNKPTTVDGIDLPSVDEWEKDRYIPKPHSKAEFNEIRKNIHKLRDFNTNQPAGYIIPKRFKKLPDQIKDQMKDAKK